MAKDIVYMPAGPPVGSVNVQPRPAAPDHDPTSAKPAKPTPDDKPNRTPKLKVSFDDKLPEDWLRASKPQQKGFRMAIWWLYCFTHAYNVRWIPVPKPFWSYKNYITETIAIIRAKKHKIMAIVCAVSRKGGTGKTSVDSWMTSLFALYIDIVSVLFDADSGSDTAGGRHDVYPDPDHLTSLQAAEMILRHNWMPTKTDLTNCIAYDKLSQAYVIPHAIDIDITPAQMEQIAKALKPACDMLFIDTAPGVKEKNVEGAIKASTVTIVNARHSVTDKMDDMRGISQVLNHPSYGLTEASKLDSVILAISAVRWLSFNLRTQYEIADKYGVRPDQVVLIPYKRYLYDTKLVNPENVSSRVVYAMTNLMLAIANAAERYNDAHRPAALPGQKETLHLNPVVATQKPQQAPVKSAPVDAH